MYVEKEVRNERNDQLTQFKGTNITTITTTQSDIAADLDSFSSMPWLISSYMVGLSFMVIATLQIPC